MKSESATFAAEQLRANDRDRYLATLVLPDAERAAITALYAFNADIASVRDRAREAAAGEIRLQWWHDALAGEGHGAVRANPLADALLDTVAEYSLPVPALIRMIEARRFDLYDDPMPDMPTFEGYAGETASALYQLSAMILNRGPVEPGDAAGHLGVAHALIGHLRAFGYNASKGRIVLPRDVFATCGVAEADIRAGTQSENLSVALTRFAELAAEHLRKADVAIAGLPRGLRAVFAPMALLHGQLKRLDLDAPFAPQPDLADWLKIAVLGWWKLRRA
ncbi:MAG: squalene/phytoene synthase family protein [Devosia sp.]|uniref:phytoene/squalene synthase family protein n=1 Tax=Devosia sp. TaxID=1871048 RepID=UPI001A55B489|nr:phytoene/squalene synthase family protein [Devosia sp.]MBL8599662.1 squalene/phytoene synthase family protein [Devosia sp.]